MGEGKKSFEFDLRNQYKGTETVYPQKDLEVPLQIQAAWLYFSPHPSL